MARKCNSCRRHIGETDTICPHCKTLLVNDEVISPQLSEHQEKEIAEILKEKLPRHKRFLWQISWRVCVGAFAIIGIVGTITGWSILDRMRELTKVVYSKVEEQFKTPRITQIVQEVAEHRATKLLHDDIDPQVQDFRKSVESRLKEAEASKNRILELEKKVAQTRADITTSYESLAKETELFRLVSDAKLGDRKAFDVIQQFAQTQTNHLGITAKSLLEDIRYHFELFKTDPFSERKQLVNTLTGQNFRAPAEQLYASVVNIPQYNTRVACVEECGKRGLKFMVGRLVEVVKGDLNLKVSSRAVSNIETLTGEKFGSMPPFDDVAVWWKKSGHTNEVYKFPLIDLGNESELPKLGKEEDVLKFIEKLISDKPGVARIHYYLATNYLKRKENIKAKEHLKKIEDECDGQVDAMMLYAGIYAAENDCKRAIEILTRVLPFVPDKKDFEKHIKDSSAFDRLVKTAEFRKLFSTEPAK